MQVTTEVLKSKMIDDVWKKMYGTIFKIGEIRCGLKDKEDNKVQGVVLSEETRKAKLEVDTEMMILTNVRTNRFLKRVDRAFMEGKVSREDYVESVNNVHIRMREYKRLLRIDKTEHVKKERKEFKELAAPPNFAWLSWIGPIIKDNPAEEIIYSKESYHVKKRGCIGHLIKIDVALWRR